MEQLPKIVGQRLQAVRPETHPDANLLAAFAEKSLLPREQASVLEHLASCLSCREVVAFAQPQEEMAYGAVAAAGPVRAGVRRSWLHGATVRWAGLAACVVIVATVVISRSRFAEKTAATVASKNEAVMVAKSEEQQVRATPPAEQSKAKEPEQFNGIAANKTAPLAGMKRYADELSEPKLDKQELDKNVPSRVENRQQTESLPITGRDTYGLRASAANAASPASAPLPIPNSDDAKATKKEFSADKAMKVPTVSQTVEVTSEAVQVQTQAMPATDASVAGNQSSKSVGGGIGAFSRAKDGYAPTTEVAGALSSLQKLPIPQWQLSAKGKLLRSNDSGKSWKTDKISGKVVFRALCVTDREVWVGGAQGNLFYSANAGENWEQVKPSANGQNLTADVLTIEFKDPQHGTLTTSAHQTWTTTDGGHAWQVESR